MLLPSEETQSKQMKKERRNDRKIQRYNNNNCDPPSAQENHKNKFTASHDRTSDRVLCKEQRERGEAEVEKEMSRSQSVVFFVSCVVDQ